VPEKLGRWSRGSSPRVNVGLAIVVIAMSFGLLLSL
jgi:hypothetical protein